jgi:hypothetical protein
MPIIPTFVTIESQRLKEPQEEIIINKSSPTKGKRMKWDWEKEMHQQLVGQIQ